MKGSSVKSLAMLDEEITFFSRLIINNIIEINKNGKNAFKEERKARLKKAF